jgi:hypothetical protein
MDALRWGGMKLTNCLAKGFEFDGVIAAGRDGSEH